MLRGEGDYSNRSMSLAIPVVVLLSQCMGVGGCVWPTSWRMRRIIFPSLQLQNKAANSASAADVTTNFRIPQYV